MHDGAVPAVAGLRSRSKETMGSVCRFHPWRRGGDPASASADQRAACKIPGRSGSGCGKGAGAERVVAGPSAGGSDLQKMQIPSGEKGSGGSACRCGGRAWHQPGRAGGPDRAGPGLSWGDGADF